jgi:lipid-binding SYLF domain-containing protein
MTTEDPSLNAFLQSSYGYALFPHAGKAGLVVGGAYGRGVVYERGQFAGYSDITQGSVGVQAGGQSFSELLVFENKAALDRFRAGQLSFAAGASAVVLKSGAATNARFVDGVAVVVSPIGGAMVEAAIGGQQFTYQPK